MTLRCPQCDQPHLHGTYICPRCGEERIPGGQLIDAMASADDAASFRLSAKLIPPAVVALSAIVGKLLHLPHLWIVGLAGTAAFFLLRRNHFLKRRI